MKVAENTMLLKMFCILTKAKAALVISFLKCVSSTGTYADQSMQYLNTFAELGKQYFPYMTMKMGALSAHR